MFERTGFRTSGLRHLPIQDVLQGIATAGYNTVEFCLEHPGASAETLQSARETGLSVSAVSYHGKRDSPEERLKQGRLAVNMAAQSGVDIVVLGSPLSGVTAFRKEVLELYSLCVEKGVKPAWETEPGTVLNSLEEFESIIVPLGTLAGLNLDSGHLHLQGRCTVRAIESLGSRIHHVHAEGMLSGIHRHLVPGTGDLDWMEFLAGLSNAGYTGSLTIDLFDLPVNWRGYILDANIALRKIISYYAPTMSH